MGFSLILAIGAQNAYILKQGLRREYVFWLCLICSISDAILILVGVFGFAWIVEKLPAVTPIARYGGALFLFLYGAKSFITAFKSNDALIVAQTQSTAFYTAILTCLALTWLNPHVYLDTVVLLGSISVNFHNSQVAFALGAITASFTFFFALGYGARFLAPIFIKPIAWKVLEFFIGIIMWSIVFSLIFTF